MGVHHASLVFEVGSSRAFSRPRSYPGCSGRSSGYLLLERNARPCAATTRCALRICERKPGWQGVTSHVTAPRAMGFGVTAPRVMGRG